MKKFLVIASVLLGVAHAKASEFRCTGENYPGAGPDVVYFEETFELNEGEAANLVSTDLFSVQISLKEPNRMAIAVFGSDDKARARVTAMINRAELWYKKFNLIVKCIPSSDPY